MVLCMCDGEIPDRPTTQSSATPWKWGAMIPSTWPQLKEVSTAVVPQGPARLGIGLDREEGTLIFQGGTGAPLSLCLAAPTVEILAYLLCWVCAYFPKSPLPRCQATVEPSIAQPHLPWPRMWLMQPRCLSPPSPTAAGILAGNAMSLLLALQHLHGKNTPAASCSQVGSWQGGMWGIPAVTPQLCPAPW